MCIISFELIIEIIIIEPSILPVAKRCPFGLQTIQVIRAVCLEYQPVES